MLLALRKQKYQAHKFHVKVTFKYKTEETSEIESASDAILLW